MDWQLPVVAVLLPSASLAGGCPAPTCEACLEIAPGEPIVVGGALALTGAGFPTAVGGEAARALELAASLRGDVAGHGWEVALADSLCSGEGGADAAEALLEIPGVAGVVGTTCSVAAIEAVPRLSEAGLAVVSPSNTSPVLTAPSTRSPGYFRIAGNDARQARRLAVYARDVLGATSASAVRDGSEWSEAMAEALNEILPPSPAGDITYLLLPPADSAMAAAGFGVDLIGGPDLLLDPAFVSHPAAEGAWLTRWEDATDPARYADLQDAWIDRFGDPPSAPFHAHAFDAAELLLDAVEASATGTPDGGLLVDLAAVRERIAATRLRRGTAGLLTCDEHGDCATAPVEVVQVRGGVPTPP